MQRRLGQGSFWLAVTDGYRRRYAVSGERTMPILDAAHIRSLASGGEHDVSNGLLLRTEIHKLFDRGYVTFDSELRSAVSERLPIIPTSGYSHVLAQNGRHGFELLHKSETLKFVLSHIIARGLIGRRRSQLTRRRLD